MSAPTFGEAEDFLSHFSEITPDPPSRREVCERCKRPSTVCWCPFLPHQRLTVASHVYILQHPAEEARCLKTAPILEHSIERGKCHIYRGKKFGGPKHSTLHQVLEARNTLLLFPGPKAVDITTVVDDHNWFNIVLLDGTWRQARSMFVHNSVLHSVKQVQFKSTPVSEYTIRTQPTDACLSTLETAAVALASVEKRPEIHEILVRPLRALCQFQMENGAVAHHSRQSKKDMRLFTRQLPPVGNRLPRSARGGGQRNTVGEETERKSELSEQTKTP